MADSLDSLSRPEYSPSSYLAAQDLYAEHRYRGQQLRRHHRHLHGWGVVCGLGVVLAQHLSRPWMVQVCPGYAIGPYGDEIWVPQPVQVNVSDYLWQLRVGQIPQVAFIGICYAETEERPVPATAEGCACAGTKYVPSRIRDSFQVDVLWTDPYANLSNPGGICDTEVTRCPDCPDSPYVLLARISLPRFQCGRISWEHIQRL